MHRALVVTAAVSWALPAHADRYELDTLSATVAYSRLWRHEPADGIDVGGYAGAAARGWSTELATRPSSEGFGLGYDSPTWLLPRGGDVHRLSVQSVVTGGALTFNNVDAADLLARYPSTLPVDIIGGTRRYGVVTTAAANGPLGAQQGWYYVQAVDARESMRALGAAIAEESVAPRYTVNLGWAPDPVTEVTAGARYDGLFIDNAGLSSWYLPSAARQRYRDDVVAVLSARRQLAPRLEAAATYDWWSGRDDWRAAGGVAEPGHYNLDTYERWGNYPFTMRRRSRRHRVDAHLSGFLDGVLTAADAHTVTLGIAGEVVSREEDETRNGGFTFVDLAAEGSSGTPLRSIDEDVRASWELFSSDRGDELHAKLAQASFAAYLEDDVELGDRVTVTPGLRYEHFRGRFAGGPEVWRTNTLAPRLAMTAALSRNHATRVFGQLGRHYRHLEPSMYVRAKEGAAFSPLEYWDWTGDPTAPVPPLAAEEWTRRQQFAAFVGSVDDELEHPSVDRLLVGAATGLPDHGLELSLHYEYRRYRHLLGLYDAGFALASSADAEGSYELGQETFTTPQGAEETIEFYDLRAGATPRYRLGNPPGARRRVHRAVLEARGELGSRIVVSGELAFTSDRGNLDSDGDLSMEWRDPSGTIRSDGRMPGYDAIDGRLGASWRAPLALDLDVDYRYRSGAYYSRVVRIAPTVAPRVYVFDEAGRGGYRYPSRHLVDARIARDLPLPGGRWRIWLEGRNLLNSDTIIGFRERARFFESVSALERPLELRVGVRYDR